MAINGESSQEVDEAQAVSHPRFETADQANAFRTGYDDIMLATLHRF